MNQIAHVIQGIVATFLIICVVGSIFIGIIATLVSYKLRKK